jgi:ADP-heptose:LPS heptosyltransferase
LIDACDFVITISNINAHIAGALGKKTFLLAPFSKGRIWYWHDSLEHSLWYPSIQIFTQTKTGDWSVPINQIKEKIVEEITHE